MQIAVGSDRAGLSLKELLANHCIEIGHDVADLGTYREASVGCPDLGAAAGHGIARDAFLATSLAGGRHARRIDTITKLEEDS